MDLITKAVTAVGLYLTPSGHTPEFDEKRSQWMQNVDRETLLKDLTRIITEDGPDETHWACFRPQEIKSIRDIFHSQCLQKGNILYWNRETFVEFVAEQIPPSCTRELSACSEILYRCFVYFAFYPLPAPEGAEGDVLPFEEYIRALGFLTRNGKEIFHGGDSTWTDSKSYESLFRSMTFRNGEPSVPDAKLDKPDDDVLDVLAEVQPLLNDRTLSHPRETFQQIANRLSPGRTPLDFIRVSKMEFHALLSFLIKVLIAIEDRRRDAERLCGHLLRIREGIALLDLGPMTYRDVEQANPQGFKGEPFYHLQHALAVLFYTFIQENGIESVNRAGIPERGFELHSLLAR